MYKTRINIKDMKVEICSNDLILKTHFYFSKPISFKNVTTNKRFGNI